ncbi:hypothetical protein FG386_003283 [Cryptosporidium ryanae]|uniref:uncharacterized protein n=1 Tax=Cryptosporidium ryanae TaxID=515981 RepID=UPI00351A0400|nr:hypothetical protein FG386_003283 [Cryptosporidium ryanae]
MNGLNRILLLLLLLIVLFKFISSSQAKKYKNETLEDVAKNLLEKFESMEYPGLQNVSEPLNKVVYGPFFYEINNVSLPLNITSLTGGAFNPPNNHESAQYYYESFVTEPFTPDESDISPSFEARKIIRGGVGAQNGTYVFFQEEIQLLPNSSSDINNGVGGGNNSNGGLITNVKIPKGYFSVNGTRLPVGTTSFGPVTFPNGAILPLGALLPNGTLLEAGKRLNYLTTLPGGTLFPGGATFLEDREYKPTLTLSMNCNFIGTETYGYRCSNNSELKPDASCCITNTLCYSSTGFSNMTSLSIPAGGILPSGSNLPSNSLLLGPLTISTSTVFGGGAILPDGRIITPNTTVQYGTVLPTGTFIADTIYLETGCVLMGGLISFGSSPFMINLPAGSKLGIGTSLGGGAILKGISYLTGGAIFPNGTTLQPGTILQPPVHPDNIITETSLLFNYHIGIQDNLGSWVLPSGTLLPGGFSNRVSMATLQGGFYQFNTPFGFKNAIYKSEESQVRSGGNVNGINSGLSSLLLNSGEYDNIFENSHPQFEDAGFSSNLYYRSSYSINDNNYEESESVNVNGNNNHNLIGFRVLNYQIPSTSNYLEFPQQILLIEKAYFPDGLSSNGPILFSNGTVVGSPVIYKSSVTLPAGTFIFGALLSPRMELGGPILILGTGILPPSIRLSSSTSLPSKTLLPGGAFLPLGGVLTGDILYPSGKVVQSGTKFSSNSYIKPNAFLTNGLILPGGGIFPGGVIIPNGQFIQQMSVPPGTIFPSTTTLLGTIQMLKGGSLLPGGAVFSGNSTVPSDSQLLVGAILSQGTILPGGIVFQAETIVSGGVQLSPLNSLSDMDINQDDFNPDNYPPFNTPDYDSSGGSNGNGYNNNTLTYVTAQVNITNFYYKDQSQDSFSFFKNLFTSSLALSMGMESSSVIINSLTAATNPYNSSSIYYNSALNPTNSYSDANNNYYSTNQNGISVTFEIYPKYGISISLEDLIEILLNNVIQNPSSSFNRIFSWVGFMILTDKSPNFWTRHLRGNNRKIIKIPYLLNSTLTNDNGPNSDNILDCAENILKVENSNIDDESDSMSISLWGEIFQNSEMDENSGLVRNESSENEEQSIVRN